MATSNPTTPLEFKEAGMQAERSFQKNRQPEDAEYSRIPIGPFRRSASLRLRGERYHRSLVDTGRSEQVSPLGPAPGGLFPAITESREPSESPHRNGPLNTRQRSLSLSAPHANGKIKTGTGANKSSTTKYQTNHVRTYPNKFTLPPRKDGGSNTITPPVSPESPDDRHLDDDLDSLHSYSSVATTASCDHAYVARNGTTFSGRKMKYVVHCSAHAGQTGEEYLTPTQRAQRQIRRLKALLNQAKLDLEKRDSDIFRLTKEVVELRLYKASLTSPDDKSNSSEAVTVKENTCEDVQTPDSPNVADLTDDGPLKSTSEYKTDTVDFKSNRLPSCSLNLSDLHSSLADSGHFEDLTNSSVHSKDSLGLTLHDKACSVDILDREDERRRLITLYEKKIDDITRKSADETQDMKKQHNDKVEALLQKLADVNTRYCEMMPDYEQAKERIRELEKQLEEVSKQLAAQEEKHHKMYLQMYTKGQQAAKFEFDQATELTHASTSRVSVPELLEELQVTQRELDNLRDLNYSPERMSAKSQILLSAKEAVSLWVLGARKAMYKRIVEAQAGQRRNVDPEVTLQFLKSAIYYFLTDPDNHQGHLKAIENILGFSDKEKENIHRARQNLY